MFSAEGSLVLDMHLYTHATNQFLQFLKKRKGSIIEKQETSIQVEKLQDDCEEDPENTSFVTQTKLMELLMLQ